MRLCWVVSIKYTDLGIQITLRNGRIATLTKSHESFDYYVGLIDHSITGNRPIGLLITADNKILEVVRANHDVVVQVVTRRKEVLAIHFLGHDGIFFLAYNHPRFDEIHIILDKSYINSQPVWFIAQLPHLYLMDVELISQKKTRDA
jgi:hypothetical protein